MAGPIRGRGGRQQSGGRQQGGRQEEPRRQETRKRDMETRKRMEEEDDEEILSDELPSDDEDLMSAAKNEGVAGETEEASFVSAEEKRLLLAQQYLEQLGLQYEAKDLDDFVLTGAQGEMERVKETADNLRIGRTILYTAQKHLPTSLEVQPAASYAYTGGKEGRIIQWNIETGAKVIFPGKSRKDGEADMYAEGHTGSVNCLSMAMNGRLLVSGSDDCTVRLWDTRLAGKACIATLKGHRKPVTSVCGIGESVYSGGEDKVLKQFSLLTQKCVTTEYGHTEAMTCMDSTNEDFVLTGGEDRTLRWWNIKQSKHVVLENDANIDCVAVHHHNTFVTGDQDGKVCLWASTKKKSLCTQHIPAPLDSSLQAARWVTALATVPNTDTLFTGSDTGIVNVWKVANREIIPLPQNIQHKGVVCELKAQDGFLFGVTSRQGPRGRWLVQKCSNDEVGLMITGLRT